MAYGPDFLKSSIYILNKINKDYSDKELYYMSKDLYDMDVEIIKLLIKFYDKYDERYWVNGHRRKCKNYIGPFPGVKR